MRGVIPTTEQFADRIWTRIEEVLKARVPQVRLTSIVLHETNNNKVTKSVPS
jgi:6-pyruvoyl-tetrahydropterin synthase